MCNGNIFKDSLVMSKLSGQGCYDILEQLKVYINITGAGLSSQQHCSMYFVVPQSAL